MKLQCIDNISFESILKSHTTTIDTYSMSINETIKNTILSYFSSPSNTTTTSTNSTITVTSDNGNSIDNDIQSSERYFLSVYYKENISKNVPTMCKQFTLKDIVFSINLSREDYSSCKSLLILLVLILKRDIIENIQSSYETLISLRYLFDVLDKDDIINILDILSKNNPSFPSNGVKNTFIKIKVYSRLYKNDRGLQLHMDLNISEFISIENSNIKYVHLNKLINKNSRR